MILIFAVTFVRIIVEWKNHYINLTGICPVVVGDGNSSQNKFWGILAIRFMRVIKGKTKQHQKQSKNKKKGRRKKHGKIH